MDQLSLTIMGISVATNIIFVKWKIENERYSDAILDGVIFVALSMLFAKTVSGLSIATLASSIVSFYLYFSPPKEFMNLNIFKKKNKKRLSNAELWEEWKRENNYHEYT